MTPEQLLELSPGDLIRLAGNYYLRLEDSPVNHLEGMFVDLETGKIIHASYLVRAEDLFSNGQLALSRFYANYQY